MQYFRFNCTLLAFIWMALIANSVVAAEFYMFKDNKGRTQIQDSIPSEYIKYGYKIVNERGATIKVVPSEREQRKKLRVNQRKANEATLAEKKKVEAREQDERLMQSFSNAEEIRQAGNKKIMVVQAQIDATAKHVEAFENNLHELEAQRDAGGNANAESIEKLRESIQQNYAFIARKRKEQNRIRDEYVGYIERYQALNLKH